MSDKKKTYKLDHDLIFKLAQIHCTYEEIAAVAGTSVSTLEKRFKALIDKGRSEGKMSLRRAQFEKAKQGDVRMQIWLGKQWLDQKDQPTDAETVAPLPWEES
jgi:AraC-like DNA-binding protein